MPITPQPPPATTYTVRYLLERFWALQIRCDCQPWPVFYRDKLLTFPAEVTLGDLVSRLKCSKCGRKDPDFFVLNDAGARAQVEIEAFNRGKG